MTTSTTDNQEETNQLGILCIGVATVVAGLIGLAINHFSLHSTTGSNLLDTVDAWLHAIVRVEFKLMVLAGCFFSLWGLAEVLIQGLKRQHQ